MGTSKRFEDLECWKKARGLVKEIYMQSKSGELARDFGTRDQLRRATLSIMNNIAEGFSKTSTKEFIRYLSIAESSAAEVKSMLYVLDDLEYLPREQINSLHDDVDSTRKMIQSFIKYLNNYRTASTTQPRH